MRLTWLLGFLGAAASSLAVPVVRGMSYCSWTKEALSSPGSDRSLAAMPSAGVNWVSLNVWSFQDDEHATAIADDFTRFSSSRSSVRHAIRRIHALGMKVLLKPNVDLRNGAWRAGIEPTEAWFASYRTFLNGWADLAREERVEALSVGCEFNRAQRWEAAWRKVVAGVRARFKGKLTYAASWDAFKDVAWWDAVDEVGIDAYFPLTKKADPTLAELKEAWRLRADDIGKWIAATGLKKPVVFTEVGYRSADGTNREPWAWADRPAVDLQEQADCYEALLSTLWGRPWWGGAFIWEWETNPKAGGGADAGFTPQGKPALATLSRYYGSLLR